MSTLVLAEHDNVSLKAATLSAVTAASQMGGDVHVLVAGANCSAAAEAAAAVAGVSKVLVADNAAYEHQLAENVSLLVAELAADYDNVVAAATSAAKNTLPRVAALLDVAQISEIMSVESADTFKRPIYAGNVIATVQSSDAKKVITVRATSFDAAAAEGGSAAIESVVSVHAKTSSYSMVSRTN
jgi:electron transfer flavoprotein alpha subunit